MRGKFLFAGDRNLYVRGVTYGTFRPNDDGTDYPDPVGVDRDFTTMALNGVNTIRTYTVPPRWVLDTAQRHGLRVMVGLPWEQHVTFLDDPELVRSIELRVRSGVRACAGHPSVLGYTLGNEIPAPIVRWHGHRRIERYLERLYRAAKAEDPGALVTYVNYPSTEYLQLPFLDFVCFNVYLEDQEALGAYLARLHNVTGDRPLVLTEIGLDSHRHGELAQAQALDWQVRTAFGSGCAGAFVFAWTDEWHRGGHDIYDWDFGLTTRDRCPKPALAAVCRAFAEVPFPADVPWPRISVVVCSYNGAHTIRDCLDGLARLEYPDYEVIVVDDGSTDATAEIAQQYDVRVISTDNRGLSSARNTGMLAATGEIVAYTDDDAYPDPHWLTYLAVAFLRGDYAGVGGPNIPPPGDGPIAECVANAPGGPIHVLLSDQEAEHIPGCNMAIRKDCLQAIGGFDPQFRVAGDDVDVCWRLQERGWKLGFSPAAVVWHHRRNSVQAYLKQQVGYGRAEALLERRWPEKYNSAGHLTWAGRLYGKGLPQILGWWRGRIYHGTWGSAPFQSIYAPPHDMYSSLALMPEWYLVIGALVALVGIGLLWPPLLVALAPLAAAISALLLQAGLGAARARYTCSPPSRLARLKLDGVTALLYVLQPLARLCGRLRHGLAPWRCRELQGYALPHPRTFAIWSERWQSPETWLQSIEAAARGVGACVQRGGDYARWDLEVRSGTLGRVRLRAATEEHGAGKQLLRLRMWPRWSPRALVLLVLLAALCTGAALAQAWAACALLSAVSLLLMLRMLQEAAVATDAAVRALPVVEAASGQLAPQSEPEAVAAFQGVSSWPIEPPKPLVLQPFDQAVNGRESGEERVALQPTVEAAVIHHAHLDGPQNAERTRP